MKPILVLAMLPALSFAQIEERSTEHKSYSDVHEFIVYNVIGNIEVIATSGNTVEVDIEKILTADSQDRLALAKKEVSLAETREGGLVRLLVETQSHGDSLYGFTYNFKIRAPKNIALDLRAVNRSHIRVDGTTGDFKISNVNGGIEMSEVAGKGEVRTVNGPVKVVFAANPTGATSFKSVNGTLDVTFRHGLNADVRLKTMNGGLFTDFPVTALPVAAIQPERRNGQFIWRSNRATGVRIGRGGAELSFETLNGDVLIKSGKE